MPQAVVTAVAQAYDKNGVALPSNEDMDATGSIITPMLIHACINAVAVLTAIQS